MTHPCCATPNIVYMKIVISMIDNSGRNIRKVIIISTTICVVILSLVIAIGGWIFWKNKQKNRYELVQIQQSKS
jgi:TRAP-type C4-dicarboxylate transport system permease small subunit